MRTPGIAAVLWVILAGVASDLVGDESAHQSVIGIDSLGTVVLTEGPLLIDPAAAMNEPAATAENLAEQATNTFDDGRNVPGAFQIDPLTVEILEIRSRLPSELSLLNGSFATYPEELSKVAELSETAIVLSALEDLARDPRVTPVGWFADTAELRSAGSQIASLQRAADQLEEVAETLRRSESRQQADIAEALAEAVRRETARRESGAAGSPKDAKFTR